MRAEELEHQVVVAGGGWNCTGKAEDVSILVKPCAEFQLRLGQMHRSFLGVGS